MILQALLILSLYLVLRRIGADSIVMRAWCVIWGASSALAIPLDAQAWWHVSPTALFIGALTLSLGVGTLAVASLTGFRPAREPRSRDPLSLTPRQHRWLLMACLVPAYLSVHMLLGDLGQDYGVFSSVERLVESAAAASIARYSEEFDPAPLTRAISTSLYLTPLLVGWYVSRRRVRWRLPLLVATALPPLAWTVLLTTKASLLFFLVFTISAFLAFRVPKADTGLTAHRRWVGWVAGGGVLAALLVAVQASRGGGFDEVDLGQLFEVLSVSAIGHVFALRDWFDRSAGLLPQTVGMRTFAGVFEVLGLSQREIGMYPDQNVDVGESFTNVYSALRNLVEDAGLPLALLAFTALGACARWLSLQNTPLARAAMAVLLCWVLWSPITSLFNYNSLLLACALFVLVAAVGQLQWRRLE